MGDYVEQTSIEAVGDGDFRAQLAPEWRTWGPLGGYVAPIALRAAGASTDFGRPASFTCQYLNVAKFDVVELRVQSRRRGRRSEALNVTMLQDGKEILDAQVWAVSQDNDGLEHDYTRAPEVPSPDELPEPEPKRPEHGLVANFERREVRPSSTLEGPREPVLRNWFRFRPTSRADERFADAARAMILLDLFS